ncbi:hypothetical protein PR048_000922 [Dryococelus australis]|uniref:Uncharacterized protein n=1 Tax=Dryococelus australis TaxID=614101 RepID=A0ABQ9IG02_9NEOP|nr:hypothetical protein PR048_000922 [Dryococelus australis]
MMVIEVNMERRRNERAGETGDPRENPPTNGIVRHDSHLRKIRGRTECLLKSEGGQSVKRLGRLLKSTFLELTGVTQGEYGAALECKGGSHVDERVAGGWDVDSEGGGEVVAGGREWLTVGFWRTELEEAIDERSPGSAWSTGGAARRGAGR